MLASRPGATEREGEKGFACRLQFYFQLKKGLRCIFTDEALRSSGGEDPSFTRAAKGQRSSHHFSVVLDHRHLVLPGFAFLLLLQAADYPPGSSSGADDVLVGHRQQVPLLHGQLGIQARHALHRLHHF